MASMMGCLSGTRQMPVPSLMEVVTAAARARATKGSTMWERRLGMYRSPPGRRDVVLTGMATCSGNQRDSKPSSSALRAKVATSTQVSVRDIATPIFMSPSCHAKLPGPRSAGEGYRVGACKGSSGIPQMKLPAPTVGHHPVRVSRVVVLPNAVNPRVASPDRGASAVANLGDQETRTDGVSHGAKWGDHPGCKLVETRL